MATWPTGLPDPTAYGDPTFEHKDTAIRSPMDTGQGKVRERFTGTWGVFAFTLELTQAQQQIFWPWYTGYYDNGTVVTGNTVKRNLPFDWVNLRTGLTQRYRFYKPPKEQWVAGATGSILQKVTIELETVY